MVGCDVRQADNIAPQNEVGLFNERFGVAPFSTGKRLEK